LGAGFSNPTTLENQGDIRLDSGGDLRSNYDFFATKKIFEIKT
jgi:hypothetical protein